MQWGWKLIDFYMNVRIVQETRLTVGFFPQLPHRPRGPPILLHLIYMTEGCIRIHIIKNGIQ